MSLVDQHHFCLDCAHTDLFSGRYMGAAAHRQNQKKKLPKHRTPQARKPRPLAAVNRWLRRHHKLIGILLIAAGAVHGLFSSDTLWSLNLGTVTWIVSILLGISWLLRKKVKKTWMTVHRLLTVAFVALLVLHIVNVGGFILDDMIAGRIAEPPSVTQSVQTETPTPTADISNRRNARCKHLTQRLPKHLKRLRHLRKLRQPRIQPKRPIPQQANISMERIMAQAPVITRGWWSRWSSKTDKSRLSRSPSIMKEPALLGLSRHGHTRGDHRRAID